MFYVHYLNHWRLLNYFGQNIKLILIFSETLIIFIYDNSFNILRKNNRNWIGNSFLLLSFNINHDLLKNKEKQTIS
jgi:hypothetical protein